MTAERPVKTTPTVGNVTAVSNIVAPAPAPAPVPPLYRDDSYQMWVVVADGAEEAPTDETSAVGRVQAHMQAGKTTITLLQVTVRETREITERPDA